MGFRDKTPPDYTAMTDTELYAEHARVHAAFEKLMAKVTQHRKRIDALLAEQNAWLDETERINDQQAAIGDVLEAREFDGLMSDNGSVN